MILQKNCCLTGFVILDLENKLVSVVNDAQRLVIRFTFESSPIDSKIIDDGFLLFGVPVDIESISQENSFKKYSLGGRYKNYTLTVDKNSKLPHMLVREDRDGFWTKVQWDTIIKETPDPKLFKIPEDYLVLKK